VKVNIANQLLKTDILLADYGFITILKQVPLTPMAAIIHDRLDIIFIIQQNQEPLFWMKRGIVG